MLATKTPVEKTTTATRITPSPGTLRNLSASRCIPGMTASAAPRTARNIPSSMPTSHIRIQTVIPMGNQTSSPVMKYCWMRRFMVSMLR